MEIVTWEILYRRGKMNGGVLSVENQRIKWVALGTLLFSVPFIYEFNIHPFFGYLTALLVSWIVVEDFYDMMSARGYK